MPNDTLGLRAQAAWASIRLADRSMLSPKYRVGASSSSWPWRRKGSSSFRPRLSEGLTLRARPKPPRVRFRSVLKRVNWVDSRLCWVEDISSPADRYAPLFSFNDDRRAGLVVAASRL